MRDIKFRGKRIDNGEWVYGNYVNDNQGHFITLPLETAHRLVRVNPATVGQFIGLHDKAGILIYEGDIVQTPYYIMGKEVGVEKHTVVFDNGSFGIRRGWDYVWLSELRVPTKYEYISNVGEVAIEWQHPFEVIGNIHTQTEMEV